MIAKQLIPRLKSTFRTNIVSQENIVYTFSQDSTVIEIRKIDKYKTALLDVKLIITEEIEDTLTISKWLLYTEGLKCDCLVTNDTSILSLALYRKNKIDTIINSAHEEYREQEMCTDFYDVMGRFIETDCKEDKAMLALVKRRKALKIGTNLIKYIE